MNGKAVTQQTNNQTKPPNEAARKQKHDTNTRTTTQAKRERISQKKSHTGEKA
jgi:hypothetical protein